MLDIPKVYKIIIYLIRNEMTNPEIFSPPLKDPGLRDRARLRCISSLAVFGLESENQSFLIKFAANFRIVY